MRIQLLLVLFLLVACPIVTYAQFIGIRIGIPQRIVRKLSHPPVGGTLTFLGQTLTFQGATLTFTP